MDELIELNGALRVPAEAEMNIRRYISDASGAYAENTLLAIRHDTAIFFRWCAACAVVGLPASSRTVTDFVDDSHSKKVTTIKRYLSSIAKLHRAAGFPDPTKKECVKLAVRRMAREVGTLRKQAKPIRRDTLEVMLTVCDRTTMIGIRDAAILAVAYDSMCRESEIVAMRVRDFVFSSDGTGYVVIPRSKTDQEGKTAVQYLHTDTVDLLKEYLRLLPRDHQGQAFRAMDGYQLGRPLQAQDVARIFKKLAKRAGVDPCGISGHSCRVGMTQDAEEAGIAKSKIRHAGRWASDSMVEMYTREIDATHSAAAELAKIQGR